MRRLHETLLGLQTIIPAVLAPGRRAGLSSSYQQFLERTRYLRRGDYGLAEKLIAPLVIGEVGVNDNFNLRMCSSFIRHHTSLCAPIQGWLHQGVLLNPEDVAAGLERAGALGAALYAGRLAMISQGAPLALYKPIGFVLSLAKDNLPETMSLREEAIRLRFEKLIEEYRTRLSSGREVA